MHYEHKISARKQGIGIIIGITLFMLPFMALGKWIMNVTESDMVFSMGWFGIVGLVYMGFVFYGAVNIFNGGYSICEVHDERIIVRTPSKILGDSFSIALSDLSKITKEVSSGEVSTVKYYLHTVNGIKYWFSDMSGCDVTLVISILEKNTGITCETILV